METDQSQLTAECFLSLIANKIMAKLTNQFSRTRLIKFDCQTKLSLDSDAMTSAQVVETSVTVTNNCPLQA